MEVLNPEELAKRLCETPTRPLTKSEAERLLARLKARYPTYTAVLGLLKLEGAPNFE